MLKARRCPLYPKADIAKHYWDVRFVPKAGLVRCSKMSRYSITSSARPDSGSGTVGLHHFAARGDILTQSRLS
jgi:hypothetical protein